MKTLGRLPTVPEYYNEFINNTVDLVTMPKQCCPFHEERTPSFSYNVETGRWSCFGKCHAHGDVIEMHRRWYHLDSREEAKKSLESLYEVEAPSNLQELATDAPLVSESKVEENVLYAKALAIANCPSRWLELDYIMSIHPLDTNRLNEFINKYTKH